MTSGEACSKAVKSSSRGFAWHSACRAFRIELMARQSYAFGVKVGSATTEKGKLIVGARAFPGNPYDSHTLAEQIEQSTILMQDVRGAPIAHTAIVDLGCRGVEVPEVEIIHRGPDQEPEGRGPPSAQTTSCGGARDRAPKGRLRTTAELAERIGRRCAASGAVCRWLHAARVDAGACRLGPKILFALCMLAGLLGRVRRKNAAWPPGRADGGELNISGSTWYLQVSVQRDVIEVPVSGDFVDGGYGWEDTP